MVTLPMTRTVFVANEEKYISSVAATAGILRENVNIIDIEEVSTRSSKTATGRLLLATLVNVQTAVLVAIGDQAYFRDQSVLNSNLNKNGLPSGTLIVLKSLISSVDVTTPSPVSVQGGSEGSSYALTPLIAGCTVGFSVMLAVIAFLVHRLRKTKGHITIPPNPSAVIVSVRPEGVQRTLKSSHYLALYDNDGLGPLPTLQHELFSALHEFLCLVVKKLGFTQAAAASMFDRLQRGALADRNGLEEALEDVPRLAQRLWTSDVTLQDTGDCSSGGQGNHELCELLNTTIRDDDSKLLIAALPLIRAINSLCVVRRARPEPLVKQPSDGLCYRGGGLPNAHISFFKPGLKYRVPGFLATSFQRTVAERFCLKAFEGGLPSVLWVVQLDCRGADNVVYRCKQVNYVESSQFGDAEAEFLFAPYSTFTVISAVPSAPNSYLNPHIISLSAATDNRLEDLDLPLAPWY